MRNAKCERPLATGGYPTCSSPPPIENSSFASCFASVELFLWKCSSCFLYKPHCTIAVSFQRGAWVLISAKIRYSSWWISSPLPLSSLVESGRNITSLQRIFTVSLYTFRYMLCYAMLLQKRKICGKKIILSISALNFENNHKKNKTIATSSW